MKNLFNTFKAIQGESVDFDSLVALYSDVSDEIDNDEVAEVTADMISRLDFIEAPESALKGFLSSDKEVQTDSIAIIGEYLSEFDVNEDAIQAITKEHEDFESDFLEVSLDNASGCDYGYKLKTVTKDGKPVKKCVRQKYAPKPKLSSAQKAHLRTMHKKKKTHAQIMQQKNSLRKTLARKGIKLKDKNKWYLVGKKKI